MPLYEYQCEKCGKVTEIIQKVTDEPLKSCPDCGGRMHKLISSPAIQFKGSGWYITDYARKNKSEIKHKPSQSSKEEKKTDEKKAAAEKTTPSTTPAS